MVKFHDILDRDEWESTNPIAKHSHQTRAYNYHQFLHNQEKRPKIQPRQKPP